LIKNALSTFLREDANTFRWKLIKFGILYRIEFSPGIAVFTTIPESCFGDVALAVHPADERYIAIVGTFLKHPITEKEIPIVANEAAGMEFGSRILKITHSSSAFYPLIALIQFIILLKTKLKVLVHLEDSIFLLDDTSLLVLSDTLL